MQMTSCCESMTNTLSAQPGTMEALKIRNKAGADTQMHTEQKARTTVDAHTDTNALESGQYWTQARIKTARKTKQSQSHWNKKGFF